MAKGIIVLDIPKSCDLCDFYDDDYCGYPRIGEDISDYIASRPEWCPIGPLPERKKQPHLNEILEKVHGERSILEELIGSVQAEAYNSCLDDIEGLT